MAAIIEFKDIAKRYDEKVIMEHFDLAVEEGEDLVTLLTCTPYGVNSDRLLVRGHRVPYVPEEVEDEQANALFGTSLHTNYLLWVAAGLAVTAAFIGYLSYRERKRQGKKSSRKRHRGRD